MRTILSFAALLGLAAPAMAQSDFVVATAAQQQAIIVQCQQDLGYGAAGLSLGHGGSGAKGSAEVLMAVPNAQISPAAANEINACARSSAAAVVYAAPAPRHKPAPRAHVVATYGCPPDAPVMYRGTMYCR
ncbi:hypothetical protein ACOXXX_13795 [Thalassococcus sp. BH17M4-6]|uniref:hypothetical protein n=1 Tax=Thalassococcus sp. BH17M4-6 TaxID=3413148 RepID=UPI003BDA7AD5